MSPDRVQNATQTKAYGLLNNNNNYVSPEGAFACLDNMLMSKENLVEKRFGFDVCSNGLPPSLPQQLFSFGNNVYCHINNQLYTQPGNCNWSKLSGISSIFNRPVEVVAIPRIKSFLDADYLYIAEEYVSGLGVGNSDIRRLRLNDNFVQGVAGNPGVAGYMDGIGTAALFSNPGQMAYDNYQTIYIADTDNHRVRALNISTNTVTTLAGSGAAVSADGLGVAASFSGPYGIAYDDTGTGALYVSDGKLIRKIDISTTAVTTVIGNIAAPVSDVIDGTGTAAACNSSGKMWLDDFNNTFYFIDGVAGSAKNVVRRATLTTFIVTTIAGQKNAIGYHDDVIGTNALFQGIGGISGVSFLGGPQLYVTDGSGVKNQAIRVVEDYGTNRVFKAYGPSENEIVNSNQAISGDQYTLRLPFTNGIAVYKNIIYLAVTGTTAAPSSVIGAIEDAYLNFIAGTLGVTGYSNGISMTFFEGPR